LPRVRVFMADPDQHRVRLASSLGADSVAPSSEELVQAIGASNEGLGADAVFDTVGGQSVLDAGLALSRPGGTVVLFAHAPDGASAQVDLNTLFKSERRIVATYSSGLAEQKQVFDLICDGSLDPSPLVTHKLPLDRFEEGVALAVERKALKVLFTPATSGE
jgi:threonine dehydrogenase-like Zn-dependent dehydrogenase